MKKKQLRHFRRILAISATTEMIYVIITTQNKIIEFPGMSETKWNKRWTERLFQRSELIKNFGDGDSLS